MPGAEPHRGRSRLESRVPAGEARLRGIRLRPSGVPDPPSGGRSTPSPPPTPGPPPAPDRRQSEKGTGVSLADLTRAKRALHAVGESEQTEGIGDAGAGAADALGDSRLRQPKI